MHLSWHAVSSYELELNDAAAPGLVVATLAGELDLTNARELEERLADAAPPESTLAVDVNRVVFIDSAALHVLFKVARRRGDGRLVLVLAPDAAVSRTLEIVGIREMVRAVSSLDDLEPAQAG